QQNSFETAVQAAWNALFEPGPYSLPATIARTEPMMPVPPVQGGSLDSKVNLCSGPDGSRMAKSNAKLDLDGMRFRGLPSIAQDGPVKFSQDVFITFPTRLTNVQIMGRFNVTQSCCTPTIAGCLDAGDSHQGGTFSYKVTDCTMSILGQRQPHLGP